MKDWYSLEGIPSDLLTDAPVGERRLKVEALVEVPPVEVDNVGIKDTTGAQIDPATKQEQIRLYDAFDLYQQAFIDEDFATEATLQGVLDTLGDILTGQLADNHQVTVSNFPETQTVDGSVDVGNFPETYPLPQSQVDALAPQTDALTETQLRGVVPDQAGAWGYGAGASGTYQVPANKRVLQISATAGVLAASFTIDGGAVVTIPSGRSLTVEPKGNLSAPNIAFTNTTAYFVEWVE